MTTTQVVETSATNNSLSQDYPHLDNHTKHITDTPGLKPFTNRVVCTVKEHFFLYGLIKSLLSVFKTHSYQFELVHKHNQWMWSLFFLHAISFLQPCCRTYHMQWITALSHKIQHPGAAGVHTVHCRLMHWSLWSSQELVQHSLFMRQPLRMNCAVKLLRKCTGNGTYRETVRCKYASANTFIFYRILKWWHHKNDCSEIVDFYRLFRIYSQKNSHKILALYVLH